MQDKGIGEIIAEAREKAGLSQRALSKIANVSNAEISKIESGERDVPNPKTLRKISKYININYNELMNMIGLGLEVSPLNPFIKDYYSKMNMDELNNAEINVLGTIDNLDKLIKSCEDNLKKENLSEPELELLNKAIEDNTYQLNTQKEIITLIQSLKIKERNKNAKN